MINYIIVLIGGFIILMNVHSKNLRKTILNDVDKSKRFLEIGPLCSPLLNDVNSYFTCDIKNTEEVKSRYHNDPTRDIKKVISIDFVMEDSYEKTFENFPLFDYVINSHVFEHIPNPIFFLQDISKILSEKGKLIMIMPDKRYCYDYYRECSSFAEMYNVWEKLNKYDIDGEEKEVLYPQILDSFSQQCMLNNPKKFWKSKEYLNIKIGDVKGALKNYNSFKSNEINFDRHFWCFSDFSFLKIIYNLTKYQLLPFKIKEFFPTRENTFAFGIILEKDEKIAYDINETNKNLNLIFHLMKDVLNYHESLENKHYIKIINKKDKIIKKQENQINKLLNSNSWKIAKPLRKMREIINITKNTEKQEKI